MPCSRFVLHSQHPRQEADSTRSQNSASYFLGDSANESLQRVYGISFPDTKQMTEYKKFLEEAAKRDHRRIGKVRFAQRACEVAQILTSSLSTGPRALLLPRAQSWKCLLASSRNPHLQHPRRLHAGALTSSPFLSPLANLSLRQSEYRKRNYQEVISPNMYNSKLWQTSGHWENYSDDMFKLDVEKEQFALKPMNCPGHCLIFASRDRSYRELPIRMADFGVLHRNEASGALTGLTRVRRFQQDDAHHFCMPDQVRPFLLSSLGRTPTDGLGLRTQIEEEMSVCFNFLESVYGMFGFDFALKLSTRPDKFLGEIETWDKAEKVRPPCFLALRFLTVFLLAQMLSDALDKFVPGKWTVDPGDGAFYGPKIDITISDALRRKHQCATIQLDFQLPQRFDLNYRSADSSSSDSENRVRPVMIHRAILGSVERFVAILTEHFAGKWCVSSSFLSLREERELMRERLVGHSGSPLARSSSSPSLDRTRSTRSSWLNAFGTLDSTPTPT